MGFIRQANFYFDMQVSNVRHASHSKEMSQVLRIQNKN